MTFRTAVFVVSAMIAALAAEGFSSIAQPRLDIAVKEMPGAGLVSGGAPYPSPSLSLKRIASYQSGSGPPLEVELSGWSAVDVLPVELITGANPERYSKIRKGPSFGYSVKNVATSPTGRYNIEVYFSERASLCPGAATFQVYFDSNPDAPLGTPLFTVDLCSSGTLRGVVRAAKLSILGATLALRQARFYFIAIQGNATVSHIRIVPEEAPDSNAQVVPSDESRIDYRHHDSDNFLPARAIDFSKLDVREAVISRFGSRHTVVAAPQRLGFMYSGLGIDASDLQELVVVVSVGTTKRAFPLTDRYPLLERISQSDGPTGVRFVGSDPSLGLDVALDLRAPFWPQDEQTTLLPSIYLDLALTNTSGVALTPEIAVAFPVLFDGRDSDYCRSCAPKEITPTPRATGAAWSGMEAVGESSTPGSGTFGGSKTVRVEYALVAMEPVLTEVAIAGVPGENATASSSWLPSSAESGVAKVGKRIFRRIPRGHTGFVWKPASLSSGQSRSLDAVFASYVGGSVVGARIPAGDQADYAFRYRDYFADLTAVIEASVVQKDAHLAKAHRFDSLISGDRGASLGASYSEESAALRRLLALAFRSYAANAWWLSRSSGSGTMPSDLFTIAEGAGPCCRFQSTVDVTYNDSALLLALWPHLLAKMLDLWPVYASDGGSLPGKIVPHDIGIAQLLAGQTYISMPVEENTDYVLLQYAYWKTTGDSVTASARLPFIKDLMRYVEAADLDGDGLAEEGVTNTIDAANSTLFRSPGQIYLGLKSAAAARAASELSSAVGDPDLAFRERMDALHHRVLHTLENAAWRGDHFAVTLDPSTASSELRNFGSIYPSGTLIYNLLYGGDLPLSRSLLERMRQDAKSVASRTAGPYGSVHMERGETSGWASQSALRDMAALALGADPADSFLSNLPKYLAWQEYLARVGDGGWWDTFTYTGSSEEGFTASIAPTARGTLGYYSRGGVLFAFAQAYGGVTLDRSASIIGALPWARPGTRVPLYTLADWTTGTVPYATVQATNPPTLVIEDHTSSSSSLSAMARPIEAPTVVADSPNFAPVLGESVTISVTGTVSEASLSAGHAGNSFYRRPLSPPFSYIWDGISGTIPVADAEGTACSTDSLPKPWVLQAPGCVKLSVDTNSPEASTTWYLAEGATAYGFETYILIQNPGASVANVAVTYMTPEGPVDRAPLELPPRSRRTIVVSDDLPDREVATRINSDRPVVVERAMYWRGTEGAWREAHAVVATRTPSVTWYLPEGSTKWGFDEWILLQNPSSTTADISLKLVAEDGRTLSRALTLGAGRRATIRVGDLMPQADVAAEVRSTVPIVAERAMYWGGPNPTSGGGSAAMGLLAPSSTWYFAEGSTDWGFETWILLYNPNNVPVGVDIVYMTQSGPRVRKGITMPAMSRQSISMRSDIGSADSGIYVRGSRPILAERAMYYSPDGSPAGSSRAGHASQGTSSPSNTWYLAEGSTAHGLHEYVLIQNPGPVAAQVQLSLRTEAGEAGTYSFRVGPGSRWTVYLNRLIFEADVSVAVFSTRPVVVERAMYTGDYLGYLVMQGANAAK